MQTIRLNAIVFTYLLAILISNSLVAQRTQQEKSDYERLGLQGNVKELTESYFDIQEKFGTPTDILKEKWVYKFNDRHQTIEKLYYDGYFESPFKRYTYSYNQEGLLEKYYEGSPTHPRKTREYKYDNMGRLIREDDTSTFGEVVIYKYNERGLLQEEAHYNNGGDLKLKSILSYDNQGRLIKEESYYRNGPNEEPFEVWSYKYDLAGNVSQEHKKGVIGSDQEEANYTYQGTVLRSKKAWDRYEIITSEYDSKGNVVREESVSHSGTKRYLRLFKYDLMDSNGNWLIQVRSDEVSEGIYVPTKKVKRTLSY